MASTKTVNGKLTGADGSIRPYGTVLIQLSTPTVIVGQQEVTLGPISVAASTVDGTWSVSLYSNSDLSPANTYYTVTEITDVSTSSYTISVPGTAGPFQASSIVTLPSVSGLPAGHVSTLIVDSTATFNGAVAFNSTLSFAGSQTFQSNLDVRGSLVDGGQASGVVGISVGLANVGTVTAETVGFQQSAQTLTLTGGFATQRFALFKRPTLSGAFTVTTAATLVVENAPATAGGATITNPYALWVQAGDARFGGNARTDGILGVGGNFAAGRALAVTGATELFTQSGTQVAIYVSPNTAQSAPWLTLNSNVQTATSATAGANGAVPAQVAGYMTVTIGSTVYKIPYFPS